MTRYICKRDSLPVSGRKGGRSGEERRLWCAVRDLYWWRYISHGVLPVFLVVVLLASAVFPLSGCKPNKDTVNKLEGTLNQLIRAEEKGEAEEFARQGSIELLDGSVRVIIECLAGHAEEVARAASAFGIVELTVRDWVQAVVPIANLNALDEVEGIRFIRMPRHPEEEAE